MKARIPKHREFIINFPDSIDQNKANEGWAKLQQIVEDYKKAHNGASVYAPTFIEDCEAEVKKLQEEYGFEYTVEYVQSFLIFKIPSVHLRRGDLLFQGEPLFPCGVLLQKYSPGRLHGLSGLCFPVRVTFPLYSAGCGRYPDSCLRSRGTFQAGRPRSSGCAPRPSRHRRCGRNPSSGCGCPAPMPDACCG